MSGSFHSSDAGLAATSNLLCVSVTVPAVVRFDSSEFRAGICPIRDAATVEQVSVHHGSVPAPTLGVSRVGSRSRPRPTRSTATLPQEPHDRRQHLHRSTPPRPRGPRGGSQAPGHVHRVHRHPRPHALPVGDHRQRRRRGAGRRLRPDRGHPAPRRLGRGPRPWSRHPGRQGAEDRPAGRRGDLHQAPRGREVRRLVVRRDRWPARRRRLGRERSLGPARRRRRPPRRRSRG